MERSEHPYHRSVAPMMWVLVALASVELVVVHVLLALWNWRAALIVSLLTLSGVVWLVVAIRSFGRLPVVIEGETLLLRAGSLKSVSVPLSNIAGVRQQWESGAVKAPGVRNLALIAYPNVMIDLREPIGARGTRTIAHKLDAPDAFVAALRERGVA